MQNIVYHENECRRARLFSALEASASFRESIKSILTHSKSRRFVLMFDEVERITFETGASDHWSNGDDFLQFWRSLRALFQEAPDLISFVIVGTNPKCVEDAKWKNQDNPIFNSFSVEYLKGFDYEQTSEMVQKLGSYMGLEFNPKICVLLHDDYGGHPYLMRHMCSTVHKLIP